MSTSTAARRWWRRPRVWLTSLGALLCAAALSGPAAAQPTVVMTGLDNPRGLTWHAGALYVAEAGIGGVGPCIEFEGASQCYGPSGAISRLRDGVQERVLTHLPSLAGADGFAATGPHDVAFRGAYGFTTIGNPAVIDARTALSPRGSFWFGRLVRFIPGHGGQVFSDLVAFERAFNPDGAALESNPYGLLAPGARAVTDAAGNSLLAVDPFGRLSLLAVFPSRVTGDKESVPTAVERGPDGALYVGELTGGPFPVGGANVYRVVPGEEPEIFRTGFTAIMDIDFGPDGSLYVLQFATQMFLEGPGELVRVSPDGSTRETVIGGLVTPTSVLVRGDSIFVTNFGIFPGGGQVLQLES